MEVTYLDPNNIDEFKAFINTFDQAERMCSGLLLMADSEKYDTDQIINVLSLTKKRVIGGVFPEIIFKGERKSEGILFVSLSFNLTTHIVDLSESSDTFSANLCDLQMAISDSMGSLFVFVDAFSKKKDDFIASLFNHFGIRPTYIGGGAGSLSFKPFPCVITNDGFYQDVAVIGLSENKIGLGVAHGWHSISTNLKVTKAVGNRLESINWRPAFEVYKEIVEKHSGLKFSDENFFDIAKSYPLGISKIDAEMVVRDPYMIKDNMIYLVDTIKEGEHVNVLHGDIKSLIKGAETAKEIALTKLIGDPNDQLFFCIDCISRVLFLQHEFSKELEIIGKADNVNGILSIGEIANSEESYLEIYNKTVVVGVW